MSLPGGQYYAIQFHMNNGDKMQFTSRDRKHGGTKEKDPDVGLKRFGKMIYKYSFQGIENVAIYDHREGNPENGTKIYQQNRGKVLLNKTRGIV